jgi:hypothetical protein
MRYIMLVVIASLLFQAAGGAAQTVRLTMYDDGLSCPGNCDAHVVFDPSMNGTQFAHAPGSETMPFAKCAAGADCRICLSAGNKQCMTVVYRGGGPSPMTFDLTPAFYERECAASSALPLLAQKCAALTKAAASLVGRTNCIRDRSAEGCKPLISDALAVQEADRVVFNQCKSVGEAKFNSGRPQSERRSNNCAYEFKGTGGPNSKGTTWRKLLPGVCRPGTFVGRDGLDCCSGNVMADGPLGLECRVFYVKP